MIIISITLVFCQANNSFGASLWLEGDGSDAVEGGDSPASLDDLITASLQDPLDRLLDKYITGCTVTVTDDETLTVSAGCLVGQDSGGVHRFRENTSTATVDNTVSGNGGLDSGSVAASTFYHIYADLDADATTFTLILSVNETAPTANCTYYRYIGSALTDADSDWLPYFWSGTGKTAHVMWDVPINETTTVNAGTWLALDCTSSMPFSSTLGIFGIRTVDSTDAAGTHLRPKGSTWSTDVGNGIYSADGSPDIGAQRFCMTDSSQEIEYYNNAGDSNVSIDVEGFVLNR